MITSTLRTCSTALLATTLALLASAPARGVPISPAQPNVTIYVPMGFAFGQTFGSSNNVAPMGGGGGGGGGGGVPSSFWGAGPTGGGGSSYLPPYSNVSGPQNYSILPSYTPAPPAGATLSVPDTGATALLLAAALVLVFGFNRRLVNLMVKPSRARAK